MNSGEYREYVGNLSDMGTHVIILLNGALSCIWESVQLDLKKKKPQEFLLFLSIFNKF